jgi:predicted nucleotidyltransferase
MAKRKKSPSIEWQIQRMVRRIVAQFHPERVILFGSQARGEAGPDSDVDLLVVMPVKVSRRRQKQVDIRVALHDIPVPKDIIVTSPEDFAWRKEVVGTIEHPAAREGKVLYARE